MHRKLKKKKKETDTFLSLIIDFFLALWVLKEALFF